MVRIKTKIANPERRALLVTPGRAANPHKKKQKKGKKNMAAKKAKNTAKRNTSAPAKRKNKTKRNKTVAKVSRPMGMQNKHHGKGHRKGRRNPFTAFGRTWTTQQILKALFGGLVGVTIVKLATAAAPASLTESSAMRTLTAGVITLAAGTAVYHMDPEAGIAVAFGGGMQTLSFALNAALPGVAKNIALQGIGKRNGMGVLIKTPGVVGGDFNWANPMKQISATAGGAPPPVTRDSMMRLNTRAYPKPYAVAA